MAFVRPMVVFSVPWNSMPSGMALSPSLNDRPSFSPSHTTTGNDAGVRVVDLADLDAAEGRVARDGQLVLGRGGVERAVGAHAQVVAGLDDAGDGGGGDLPGIPGIALVALCSPRQAERERGVAGRVPGGGDGGVLAGGEGAGGHAGDPAAARDVEDEAHVARAVGGHAGARLP